MAIESLGGGFENGLSWLVDHDETSGTIGVTVTGTPRTPGNLSINGQVVSDPSETVVATYGPQEIDQFANQGRQVLISNASLVGIIMVVPRGTGLPAHLNIWATFTPA